MDLIIKNHHEMTEEQIIEVCAYVDFTKGYRPASCFKTVIEGNKGIYDAEFMADKSDIYQTIVSLRRSKEKIDLAFPDELSKNP